MVLDRRHIGSTLEVEVRLRPVAEGGRTTPIVSGYRPLCVVPDTAGANVVVGLCELILDRDIPPGGVGAGILEFDEATAPMIRDLVVEGSEFGLSEGSREVARARALGRPS